MGHCHHFKQELVNIIGLLSQAAQLQRQDVELGDSDPAVDEQIDEQVLALVTEALSLAHDSFMAMEEHEIEEEEEEELEDAIDTVEAEGGVVEIEGEGEGEEEERLENPRGSRGWTDKDERKYQHIKASVRSQGGSDADAKRIAAATVNRDRSERRRSR